MKFLIGMIAFVAFLAGLGSCGDKKAKSELGPSDVKFALNCSQNSNPIHKLYLVYTNQKVFETDGEESMDYPYLSSESNEEYVFKDKRFIAIDTFDISIIVNRQTLEIHTTAVKEGSSDYPFAKPYTCRLMDNQEALKLVKEVERRIVQNAKSKADKQKASQKI